MLRKLRLRQKKWFSYLNKRVLDELNSRLAAEKNPGNSMRKESFCRRIV